MTPIRTPDPASAVAVLYSGGTDSSVVAAQMAQQFGAVHLVTYSRHGIFGVDRSIRNYQRLRRLVGPDRFTHVILPVERLFRELAYDRYLANLRRHGLFMLSTCGLCKLAMHLRTIVYCKEAGIGHVRDGANRHMSIFPAQMPSVIAMLKALYAEQGIDYDNPVFEYDDPQGINFGSQLYGLSPAREGAITGRTTGQELFALGITAEPDVKGKPEDKQMQARCYQMVLFNIFARWNYLPRHSMDEYVQRTDALFADKIGHCRALLEELDTAGNRSRLHRLVRDEPQTRGSS